jgi:hypothetical protein
MPFFMMWTDDFALYAASVGLRSMSGSDPFALAAAYLAVDVFLLARAIANASLLTQKHAKQFGLSGETELCFSIVSFRKNAKPKVEGEAHPSQAAKKQADRQPATTRSGGRA